MSKREDNPIISQEELIRQKELAESLRDKISMQKRFIIKTYGCQMNEHDTEKLIGMLRIMNYIETSDETEADLVIYNTCSVRENAEIKVLGNLSSLKSLKRKKPEMLIAVCGCMMQQKEIVDKIKEKYKHVDLVFGTHNIHKFPELLANAINASNMIIEVWEEGGEIIENIPIERRFPFKAFVNIMYGCNNFCSYCIVPYTRGRERSRNPQEVIKEIQELVKDGVKEITLLGQNVNSYGKTFEREYSFANLLREINEIEGLERIRFMTSHPKDLSDDLIKAMAECNKVSNHLHLPFQSGSNKILDVMNRKYSKEQYIDLALKVKKSIPGVAMTTDIIVGFPGETDEDFEDTLDVVSKVRFDSAFTFLYSIRQGTPAANMENQVDEEVKHTRFQRLLELQNSISREINISLKGEVIKVLVEGPSKNDSSIMTGKSDTNKTVNFPGDISMIGKIVKVRITEPQTWSLNGLLVEE